MALKLPFSSISKGTRIKSYINNLHPRMHKDLYNDISQIITRAIPLWNKTLRPSATRINFTAPQLDDRRRIKVESPIFTCGNPYDMEDEEILPRIDGESDEEYEYRLTECEWEPEVIQPEPGDFHPPSDEEFRDDVIMNIARNYAVDGLQVIVKLANIELTPEKPHYAGGSWHVEGFLVSTNRKIV